MQETGHLERRSADDLKEEIEYLQYLENEYPEGILEQAPWKSGKIRLSHGNTKTEEEMTIEEIKRQHRVRS